MSEQPPGDDIPGPVTPAASDAPAIRCQSCQDEGHVCEEHPGRLWGAMCCDAAGRGTVAVCEHGACGCGAPGMPCPACCSPVPEDGTHSIAEAFTPDWQRGNDLPAVALEPDTLPNHPLRAQDVPQLLPKEIG